MLVVSAASGQPAFDVASIKPAALARAGGEGSQWESVQVTPLSLTLRNVSLSYCIQWAWHVKEYEVAGPAWTNSERFDVFARSGKPVGEDQLRLMLRALLAERFHLEFHRESKDLPIYVLLQGKRGPRLAASKSEPPGSWSRIGPGLRVAFRHESVSELADFLSKLLVIGRPVLDRTGIQGKYDFTLDLRELRADDASEPGAAPSNVLSEQLGLRLEAGKAALEVLVIDRAEKAPIAN